MTDRRQILKTLYKLMTRPGPIYSRSNTKQDPVCLWLIVKIHSSRFPQLRKASTGSGNCSCVCQATLNPLSSSSSLLLWARKAKQTQKKNRENTTRCGTNSTVWARLVVQRSVITIQQLS